MINYYEVLKVPDFSNIDIIKQNYKKLILENHPDKGGDTEKFEIIKEAYELLKDNDKRKEYDNKLIYYQEIIERAEEINLDINNTKFNCLQCETENEIHKEQIKKGINQYIIKCENCSMTYKVNINLK